MDPQAEYRRGLLSNALRGATNPSDPERGARMREHANRSNTGTLPYQKDFQTMQIAEEMRAPNLRLKQAQVGQAERSGYSSSMNDYIMMIKSGAFKDQELPSFEDFSKAGARDFRSAAQKNYAQRQDIAEAYSDDPAMQKKQLAIFDNFARAQQYAKYNEVPGKYNPETGLWESAVAGKTQAEARETISEQEVSEVSAIQKEKADVTFKTKLATNLDKLDEQIPRLERLRAKVAAGPATGRVEEIGTAWDADKQALEAALLGEGWQTTIDMKDKGMTFGSFTDTEFVRILKTIGSMGNKREANLAILDRVIDEMYKTQNIFFDRWENPVKFLERKRTRRTRKAPGKSNLTEAQKIFEEEEEES